MLSHLRWSVAVAATVLCARAADAQLVRQCTTLRPTAPAGTSSDIQTAIDRVSWRASLSDYSSVIARSGPVAAFDTLETRALALLRLVGDAGGKYATDSANLHTRFTVLRASLVDAVAHDDWKLLGNFADLSAKPLPNPNQATFVIDASRFPTTLTFDPAAPLPATALCVSSMSAYQLLDFLLTPPLNKSAEQFASARKRWDLFIASGYSMTLIERLGASCRLSYLGWIVSPTTMAANRCGEKFQSLGPPTVQTIFVHPTAGIIPVRDSSGSFRSVTELEVYGFVFHRYTDKAIQTFGIGGVLAYPDRGPMHYGVIFHTPVGPVTLLDSRGPNPGAHRILLSADVLGWITANRAAVSSVEANLLELAAGTKLKNLTP